MVSCLRYAAGMGASPVAIDPARIRQDFPALRQEVHGKPLVYLDSAATALKPQAVIDACTRVYARDGGSIHRAVHALAQRATAAYEQVRAQVRALVNARSAGEVVFVRGTTEAINLVAQSFARPRLGPEDEVLVTGLEHHANLVPWQMVCRQTGARLKAAPVSDAGEVPLEGFARCLGPRTRVVAVAHVSNALGTVLPVREMARLARARGAAVVVDGAQGIVHLPVDVQDLGCDFYAFSGHKLYGPTGVGVLYGRRELLEVMPPVLGGGGMITSVTLDESSFCAPPHRFEAGTGNIAGVVGLGAAIEYVRGTGIEAVRAHERQLTEHGARALGQVPGLRLIGTAPDRAGILSFVMDGVHPHDIGTILDGEGIAVRTGHHCAQPLMARMGVAATTRASVGMYNTCEDLDRLAQALYKVHDIFR